MRCLAWSCLLLVCLAGCRTTEQAPTAPPATVDTPPTSTVAPPPATFPETLDALLASLEKQPAGDEPNGRQGLLRERLGELSALCPARAALRPLERAQALLQRDPELAEPTTFEDLRDALADAGAALPEVELYGACADACDQTLQQANDDLAERWPTRLKFDLERAAALAMVPVVEADLQDCRTAFGTSGDATPLEPAAARRALLKLARTWHLAEARSCIGRARGLADELALGEAENEVENARAELQAWAGEAQARQRAVAGLLSDLDGAAADLRAGSPGLHDRLTALWKKLGRSPAAAAPEPKD